ncbi:hypothetical protein Tco_0104382 [Tanacetum coccineum]
MEGWFGQHKDIILGEPLDDKKNQKINKSGGSAVISIANYKKKTYHHLGAQQGYRGLQHMPIDELAKLDSSDLVLEFTKKLLKTFEGEMEDEASIVACLDLARKTSNIICIDWFLLPPMAYAIPSASVTYQDLVAMVFCFSNLGISLLLCPIDSTFIASDGPLMVSSSRIPTIPRSPPTYFSTSSDSSRNIRPHISASSWEAECNCDIGNFLFLVTDSQFTTFDFNLGPSGGSSHCKRLPVKVLRLQTLTLVLWSTVAYVESLIPFFSKHWDNTTHPVSNLEVSGGDS